jgi:hypothetical protein
MSSHTKRLDIRIGNNIITYDTQNPQLYGEDKFISFPVVSIQRYISNSGNKNGSSNSSSKGSSSGLKKSITGSYTGSDSASTKAESMRRLSYWQSAYDILGRDPDIVVPFLEEQKNRMSNNEMNNFWKNAKKRYMNEEVKYNNNTNNRTPEQKLMNFLKKVENEKKIIKNKKMINKNMSI